MEKSNLRLFSNIYPWRGRWKEGDQEFVAKIWDDKALAFLKIAANKKEVTLTSYQEELYKCTVQCTYLPEGERPMGWKAPKETACLCRKEDCRKFKECRGVQGALSERELEVWNSGNQEGLEEFELTWKTNKEHAETKREIGKVDLFKVFADGEYEVVNGNAAHPFDPKIATGWPDDEEYE